MEDAFLGRAGWHALRLSEGRGKPFDAPKPRPSKTLDVPPVPQIFAGDERLAGALIDRLTHRVHVVEIQGDSYRLQASLKAKKGGAVPKTPTT